MSVGSLLDEHLRFCLLEMRITLAWHVYMSVCVYVCACECVYMSACTQVYMLVCVCLRVCVRYVCVYVQACECACVCECVCTYVYMHVYVSYVCVHIHTWTMHVHIHVHTHTYTYLRVHALLLWTNPELSQVYCLISITLLFTHTTGADCLAMCTHTHAHTCTRRVMIF